MSTIKHSLFLIITMDNRHATRYERLQPHTPAGIHLLVKGIAAEMSFTSERIYYFLKCPSYRYLRYSFFPPSPMDTEASRRAA
jgi:hypothetical protein